MPRIYVKKDPNFIGNKDFHSTYTYDLNKKVWNFTGYKCIHCEKTFKSSNVQIKHLNTCRGVSRKKVREDDGPVYILDKEGNVWTPYGN